MLQRKMRVRDNKLRTLHRLGRLNAKTFLLDSGGRNCRKEDHHTGGASGRISPVRSISGGRRSRAVRILFPWIYYECPCHGERALRIRTLSGRGRNPGISGRKSVPLHRLCGPVACRGKISERKQGVDP